jgi:hypothetical protein
MFVYLSRSLSLVLVLCTFPFASSGCNAYSRIPDKDIAGIENAFEIPDGEYWHEDNCGLVLSFRNGKQIVQYLGDTMLVGTFKLDDDIMFISWSGKYGDGYDFNCNGKVLILDGKRYIKK